MAREWAHLEEIVRLIASYLFVKDVQSCSLVCRGWRAALADWPYRRSPCLIKGKDMRQFHQHTQSFDMPALPRFNEARIHSSNHGWLLLSHSRGLFFFDPFNERTIEVKQSGKTPPYDALHFFNPPTSPECFVVSISIADCLSGRVKIGILKRTWRAWQTVKCTTKLDLELSRPVLRGGLLYFVDTQGNIATLDVHHSHSHIRTSWTLYTKCFPSRPLRNKIKNRFLFQLDEALYAVFLIYHHHVEKVNVFRLSEPGMKWESVKDLGDKIVYLSMTSCFVNTAYSQSMTNTIFFPRFHHDDLLYYSLATRKYHSLDGNYSHDGPGLRSFDGNAYVGDSVAWILPAPDTASAGDTDWQIQRNKVNYIYMHTVLSFV